MTVGKVEKLERDALLVGRYAERGEEEVNKARVARALVIAGDLGRHRWMRRNWERRRGGQAADSLSRKGRCGDAVGLGFHGGR